MKCLTRYFSALLCCLLLFTAFSTSVSAETVDLKEHAVYHSSYLLIGDNSYYFGAQHFTPNNGTVQKNEVKLYDASYTTAIAMQHSTYYSSQYHFQYPDNSVILNGDKNYTVRLSNLYHSILIEASNTFYIKKPEVISPVVTYTDGTTEYVSNDDVRIDYITGNSYFDLTFTFNPKMDVKAISIYTKTDISSKLPSFTNNYVIGITSYMGEFNGDDKYQFSLEVESEEAGLLKSVIEWLKGIKNGIADVFDSIKELPSKLWTAIENGLKSLFIPSEESISDFKENIDSMLEEKLGAVYQVIDLTFGSWDNINANDVKNTIEIPLVTIDLPNNNKFSFGGFSVQVVPSGFEFIVDIIKGFVGLIATLLFVQGMRNKYDEVMGVEK